MQKLGEIGSSRCVAKPGVLKWGGIESQKWGGIGSAEVGRNHECRSEA